MFRLWKCTAQHTYAFWREREGEREAAGSRAIVSYIKSFPTVRILRIVPYSVDYTAHAHVGNMSKFRHASEILQTFESL